MLVLSRKAHEHIIIDVYDADANLVDHVKITVIDARGVVKLGCEGNIRRTKFLRGELADAEAARATAAPA